MKVKSESEVTQACPTLSDPMDCSLPGSSVHGIFQARVLEWGAIAFSIEKAKIPENQLNEVEIGNLSEKEFRIIIVKISRTNGEAMEKMQEMFTKDPEELKNKQKEMNNTLLLLSRFSCVRLCVTP